MYKIIKKKEKENNKCDSYFDFITAHRLRRFVFYFFSSPPSKPSFIYPLTSLIYAMHIHQFRKVGEQRRERVGRMVIFF